MRPEEIVSAQVVLAAPGGARPGPQTRITSENIHEWTPSADNIRRVSDYLRGKGFQVGQLVGNSMSITGPTALFESTFDTKLRKTRGGGLQFQDGGDELAAEKIPASLRDVIASITFPPPPDFGPSPAASFA